MADFFFFTEPNNLEEKQEANQAFGVIDENNYRLGNLFTLTAKSKLFAITRGKVLVQPTTGHSDKVNIILKPEEQPNLNFPKVEYFIYKGVEKSSLISGTQVASRSKNDLTKTVWEAHDQLVEQEVENIGAEPLAEQALGLAYNANGTDDFLATDDSPLDLAFYHNRNTLSSVDPGDHVGDVLAGDLEFIIITEKVGVQPTFKIAREWDSKMSFSPLAEESTPKDIFERKHKKEEVLTYVDSTAFFSAFHGLHVFNGTSFQPKSNDEFYDQITSKMVTSSVVYLDIRNETQDSFNYFENYSDNIKLSSAQEPISYYRDGWPLLKLSDVEFDSLDGNKILELHLPTGDNEAPRFVLKKGFLENDNTQTEKNRIDFLNHIEFGDEYYKPEERIKAPVNSTGVIKANYFQLRYIKRYTTEESIFNGLSLVNDTFWDNRFSFSEMKLPFVNNGSVDVKVYSDIGYMDKTNINDAEYTANLGIARDEKGLHFFSLPENYSNQAFDVKAKVPLVSEQTFSDQTFLDHLQSKITSNSINQAIHQAREKDYPYLTFAESLKEGNPDEEEEIDDITRGMSELKLEKEELEFDFDNIDILSLTNNEVESMNTIIENEFSPNYKVYLGVTNIKYLEEGEYSSSTIDYVLRGFVESSDGKEIRLKEIVVPVEIYAKGEIMVNPKTNKSKYEVEFRAGKVSDLKNGLYGLDRFKPRLEDDAVTPLDFENYKGTYQIDRDITSSRYYSPWLSIRKDQEVVLGTEFKRRKLKKFNSFSIKISRGGALVDNEFEISEFSKDVKTISIKCLQESTSPDVPSKLQIIGDGSQVLGSLNIIHKPVKKVKFKCVFVKWNEGDLIDINKKINYNNVIEYLNRGLNPALIEPEMVNINSKEHNFNLLELWQKRDQLTVSDRTIFDENLNFIKGNLINENIEIGDGNVPEINPTKKESVLPAIKKLYELYQRWKNSGSSSDGSEPHTVLLFFGHMICRENQNESIPGFTKVAERSSMFNMGNDLKEINNTVAHEAMHALGLDHTFIGKYGRYIGFYYFDIHKTDNLMDYRGEKRKDENGRSVQNDRHYTWKWQWDLLYKYVDII